ncbi:FAD:protein FMN transferase [Allohahella marinimesophila]|uniref:FAD:protein FMN transferase n=1 Tax=Allohahella marinimesophila TaxID=1054972 RepID=A0ABP7PD66_9GAMM
MTDFGLHHYRFKALGGPCELRLGGERANADRWSALAVDLLQTFEQRYSRYRADSIVSKINARAGTGEWTHTDTMTGALLDYAAQAFAMSDGLFDITSGILRQAWDFRSQQLPPQAELIALRAKIGWELVERRADAIRLPIEGMALDFGGFGKEYACDAVATLLRQQGCQSGFVDLAGDIAVVGPDPAGQPWLVGVRHARAPDRAITFTGLSSGGFATSGDYERFMIIDGRRYCHLLNPMTATPARTPASVSVAAEACLLAGTVCTIAMLREDGAAAWLDSLGLGYCLLHDKLAAEHDMRTALRLGLAVSTLPDVDQARLRNAFNST